MRDARLATALTLNERAFVTPPPAGQMSSLSPRRLQPLLEACRSVKVKRLFIFFSNRHSHAWLKRLDRKAINLGTGKRMLVKGGRLDPATQITVPEDLNGVR
jgi:hypothetical protein